MPIDRKAVQERLKKFDFSGLFTQELGWDWHTTCLTITVDGQPLILNALAHKRGMVAYHCHCVAGVSPAGQNASSPFTASVAGASPAGQQPIGELSLKEEHHPLGRAEAIPAYHLRRKIEQQVTKSAHEHLIIFTDSAQTTQIWQWVKREPGKPAACREHTYRSQSGEALSQKLQAIAFTLEEEEELEKQGKLGVLIVHDKARKGFNVEHVTKRFYDQFKKEHASFLKFVEGIDDAADCEWYASVMLNRLMFVYFVQRKGFLDGDPHYLRNRLQRCQEEKGKDKFYSFYRYFLLRLFHEGLGGKARPQELQDLLGRIPYLNGGFFEKHVIEQRWEAIRIPDRAFERIFDYFDQYQWHLDERPLRADNEINPDVLGYIFEKYINQKQMGAYYTKEDITGYISRNTIIPFLFDAARKKHKAAFESESESVAGVSPANPDVRQAPLPANSGGILASINSHPPVSPAGGDACHTIWKLLQADPDRYIYPAIKHGITLDIHAQPPTPLKARLPMPPEIEQGVDTTKPNLIERRKAWNKPAPSEYALPTEIWREVVARRQRYDELRGKLASSQVRDINDLITLNLDIVQFAQDVIRNCDSPELLRAFWHALEKPSVLDPTVGSGAFLFAALNILKPLYEACLERMEAFVGDYDRVANVPSAALHKADETSATPKWNPKKFSDFRAVLERVDAHPNSDYFILKSIILNNLFGVDIMEEATEICKLRLFLKLAAQVDPDPAKDNFGIEPLPDIDFNIRAGNTLVGYATADEVRRAFKEEAGGQGKLMLGESSSAYQRFEEKVEDADRAFVLFRQMQTEQGVDSGQFASAKVTLRKQMKVLEDELNRYLASDYGVKMGDKAAYSKWLSTHLPFHWLVEFYGIFSSGGFDVIIGNPPYVELNVLDDYTIRGYKCEDAGNLYALVMERCEALGKKVGRQGFIVPVSSISTDRYSPLQEVLLRREDHFSSFDDRPSRLFDGLEHIRLTIHILGRQAQTPSHFSTRYNKWSSDERHILFEKLTFTPSEPAIVNGSVPKLCSPVEKSIVEKLRAQKRLLSAFYSRTSRHRIFYSRKVGYFLQVLDFEPRVLDGKGCRRPPSEFKELAFTAEQHAKLALCCLNANLFYWFITVFSDCRHVNKREVDSLPIDLGALSASQDEKELLSLADALMADLKKNSVNRTMSFQHDTLTVQCIYPKTSKPIIDRIDQALARHYGFTKEELDFLLNYDIKYRLGRDAEGDDDE